MRDYLAERKAEPGDLMQFGIKGMKWGVRKTSYSAPTQRDRDDAVRAYIAKKGKPPSKGSTIAVVNNSTNNLHIFKVNKVKSAGLMSKKKIYDMTHESSAAVDKNGKVIKTLHTPRNRQMTRTIAMAHSDDVPDYLGSHSPGSDDLVQAGVKGMKWGVRRDRSTLRAAAKGRETPSAAKKDSTPEKAPASSAAPAKKPAGNIQDNVESSSARYDRLAGQAKAGRASDMTEQDLKFFNARTEALNKINKMNEVQPSWLQATATKVIQTTAERQMQTVSNTLADKYIGAPIKSAIVGKAASGKTEAAKSDDDD